MEKLIINRNAAAVGQENGYGATEDVAVYIDGNKITIEREDGNLQEFLDQEGVIGRNERIVELVHEKTGHKVYYVVDFPDTGRRTIQKVYVYDGEKHQEFTLVHTYHHLTVVDERTGEIAVIEDRSKRNDLSVLDNLASYKIF